MSNICIKDIEVGDVICVGLQFFEEQPSNYYEKVVNISGLLVETVDFAGESWEYHVENILWVAKVTDMGMDPDKYIELLWRLGKT